MKPHANDNDRAMTPREIFIYACEAMGLFLLMVGVIFALYVIAPAQKSANSETIIAGDSQ